MMVQLIQEYHPVFLQEFVVKNISWLKKYLSMSDDEKAIDIALQAHWKFFDYLEKHEPERLDEVSMQEDTLDVVEEWCSVQDDRRNVIIRYGNYLIKNIDHIGLTHQETPSWYYMSDPKIVKNQWMVHFTDTPDDIVENQQFDHLVEDLTQLGLTTYLDRGSSIRGNKGYGFAYTVGDKMYQDYGRHMIVFRASGLRVYHNGDHEHQTLFYGPTARNINVIYSHDRTGGWYIENRKTGENIYETGDYKYTTPLNWFVKNYNQYRKVLY